METINLNVATYKQLLEDSAILGQIANVVEHNRESDGIKAMADNIIQLISNYKVLRSLNVK